MLSVTEPTEGDRRSALLGMDADSGHVIELGLKAPATEILGDGGYELVRAS